MKSFYYGTCGKQEYFREMYMGNPGLMCLFTRTLGGKEADMRRTEKTSTIMTAENVISGPTGMCEQHPRITRRQLLRAGTVIGLTVSTTGCSWRRNAMKRAVLSLLFASAICQAETIFLDNYPGLINGSATYDPETRTCGQGKYHVFTEVDQAAQALSDADVLHVRAGTYSRASVGNYISVHGHQVNYWTGALAINTSGTPQKRKLVSAYEDELVIIQARPGASNFNPDPTDTTFKNSSHYYCHPAISIGGAYVDVAGFKTYGQVVISGHNITLQNCDLGGGGPHMNQGQVIALNGTGGAGVYNVVIRNNKIHHSCWGESTGNGAALMCYDSSFIVENNEFYDNYGADISTKDTGGQQGRNIIIRYNFFGPTSIINKGNAGVEGHNQDADVDHIYIHHNVFYSKSTGISFRSPARLGTVAYNNTFVNCGYGRGETGDIGDWQNPVINVYNNLYYHSEPAQTFYDIQTEPWSNLNSDYNLFFSTTADTQWRHLYRNRGTTLAEWQQYSGKDENSVWKDPQFVNRADNRPEDFKRKGKPRDVAGSPYDSVCGAYVTGNEIIGLIPKRSNCSGSSDLNDDGIVDFEDLAILAYYWLDCTCSEPYWCDCSDLNENGRVEFSDLAELARNWLRKWNQPPWVNIIKPQDGAVISLPYEIEADAGDADGSVAKVEFFADANWVGEDDDGADGWKAIWQGFPTGDYSLFAKATDDEGAMATSPAISATVPRYRPR